MKNLLTRLATHHSKDSLLIRKIQRHIEMAEELWPWRCSACQHINKKTAVECAICGANWKTGTRHNTQPRSKAQSSQSWNWQEWSQRDEEENNWDWTQSQSRSHSRASSHSSHSAHGSNANYYQTNKGKGKSKGKGKTKQKGHAAKNSTKNVEGAPAAQSPFAPLTKDLPPWPTPDSSVNNLLPTSAPFPNQVMETIVQKREVIQALKTAYPESSNIPQDTKDLIQKLEQEIEKLEKENSKATTKNLHTATTSLGKAQKALTETLEAKRAHRQRWTSHVTDAAKVWETQLHEYRQQQSAFQEIIAKSRRDIENARNVIQVLSAKATQATLASIPPITPISAETEDLTGDGEQETEAVQQQLQQTLLNCATSLGVELTATKNAPMETEQEEEDPDKSKKRLRSLEPFGAAVLPGTGDAPKM